MAGKLGRSGDGEFGVWGLGERESGFEKEWEWGFKGLRGLEC